MRSLLSSPSRRLQQKLSCTSTTTEEDEDSVTDTEPERAADAVPAVPAELVGGVLATAPAASAATAVPPTPTGLPTGVEELASYVGANSCDASTKPGSAALGALLVRTYPGTSYGSARACAAVGDVLPDDVGEVAVGLQPEPRGSRGAGAARPVRDDAGDHLVALEAHALAHRSPGDHFERIEHLGDGRVHRRQIEGQTSAEHFQAGLVDGDQPFDRARRRRHPR